MLYADDNWWEGESARLASLAAAAFLGGRHPPPELRHELEAYAIDQLDWTFGRNLFDASMQPISAPLAIALAPDERGPLTRSAAAACRS